MRIAMITVLSAALFSPLMIGCGDKEVSHSTDQSTNPLTGNTTTTDKNTYQRPDGSTYTDKTQQTAPANHN
jgi:hypothetical protein